MKKIYDRGRDFFESIIGAKSEDTTGALYRLFLAALALILAVTLINIVVGTRFPSEFGPWGDFFGGVLNPLLTFLTFTGLLITIVLQQTELRETRKEFEKSANALAIQNIATDRQIFESTFFQMLTIHNGILNAIRATRPSGEIRQGREAFDVFYTDLSDIYKGRSSRIGAKYYGDTVKTIEASYKFFWRERRRVLGHYYRYLYNMVRFVAESAYPEGPYMRLVRAQLSDQEGLLLFYNALTEQGQNFRELIEDFALFDNLDRRWLLDHSHHALFSPAAFDSDLARNRRLERARAEAPPATEEGPVV